MPNLLPTTYRGKTQKYKRLEFIMKQLLSQYAYTQVIGLAGPDVNQYLKRYVNYGINKFEIWENDRSTADKQLKTIKYPARMRFGDILAANPNRVKTLYDFDFTMSVEKMLDHAAKFKDNFIMTFCIRKIGTKRTIKEFFKARDEVVLYKRDKQDDIKYKLINTNIGKYIYTTYRDFDGPPMCCIARIS